MGYSYDKAGRLTGVTGSGYAGVSTYANALTYRAFGGIKGMSYGNGRSLSVTYDNRLRPTRWNFGATQDYKYFYDYLNEHTGRVTYAQNMNDGRLDRSYEYDHVGRLAFAHSGAEARAHAYSGQWGTTDGPYSLGFGYDAWGNMTHRYGWGGEVQGGSAGQSSDLFYNYNGSNQRTGFTYDPAGNLTNDGGQTFTYDATGQQIKADYSGYSLTQTYDGNGLRVKKTETGTGTIYYLRSSVLGGQVVAEIFWTGSSWSWYRGYVYSGAGLLAVQYGNAVSWVHEDPVTKSKRITNSSGTVTSSIELDPWGADAGAAWSSNSAFQPRKFTTYDRDGNGSDEAMFRRHNRWHSRFDQPDPYDGSYEFGNPQSLNRYGYVQNDPVNLMDPSGLLWDLPDASTGWKDVSNGFWGWGHLGGNGWGQDPNPGRRTIDVSNNTNDQMINQTRYGGSTPVKIDSWLCFAGECWFAGSGGDLVVRGALPSDFSSSNGNVNPILGILGPGDWRPVWPKPGPSYGWPEPRTNTQPRTLPELPKDPLDGTKKFTEQRNLQEDLRGVRGPQPPRGWGAIIKGIFEGILGPGVSSGDVIGPVIWTHEIECFVLKKGCGTPT